MRRTLAFRRKATLPATRRRQIGDEHRGLVIDDGSGEVLGPGTAIAYEWEEVDAERFVKLFLNGLKQASGLSKSGLTLFEVVYNQVRQNPNLDEVKLKLSFYIASKVVKDLAEGTYLFRKPSRGRVLHQCPIHVQRRSAGLREGLPA